MTTKAYVLLSGGMDSATLLGMACDQFHEVYAVSLMYGQLHTKELTYAEQLVAHYGVGWIKRDIKSVIGKGGLSDPDFEVPNVSYDQIQGVSPTYVPFRNGLLLSIATSIVAGAMVEAEKTSPIAAKETSYVVGYGAHAEDAANWAYPDCTPEFIGSMANAIYVGSYHKIRLWTPLMWSLKSEIVREGHALGVPYHLTWSCYKGEADHCGKCPTCIARKEAFKRSGYIDPTVYAS